jgi:hypothetical protein
MRWIGGLSAVTAVLVACSSSTEGTGGGCADITGNYTVTSVRQSGTCDPALDPQNATTVTFTRSGDGWLVALPGIEEGCPGQLDAGTCRFTTVCKLYAKATGATISTLSIDYTFSGPTLAGSSVSGVLPPAVPKACDVTYRENGKKL